MERGTDKQAGVASHGPTEQPGHADCGRRGTWTDGEGRLRKGSWQQRTPHGSLSMSFGAGRTNGRPGGAGRVAAVALREETGQAKALLLCPRHARIQTWRQVPRDRTPPARWAASGVTCRNPVGAPLLACGTFKLQANVRCYSDGKGKLQKEKSRAQDCRKASGH